MELYVVVALFGRIRCVRTDGVSGSVNSIVFFFQAEDGIRDLVRSRGLGDVYKRQLPNYGCQFDPQVTAGNTVVQDMVWNYFTGDWGESLSLIHI